MKLIYTLILLSFATSALANPFPGGDSQTGQRLFEKHDCNQCHNSMMGGDGNKIFIRANRIVSDASELIAQITRCSGNVGANFTLQEKQHLGAYLNRYYNLK